MALYTRNEKAVILSIMRNPEHTDKDISSTIGMNLYTYNKVKNSLLKRHLTVKHYVPNYQKLGFEILSVSSGIISDPSLLENIITEKIAENRAIHPDFSIFGILEENNGILFNIIPDFTSLKRIQRIKELIKDRETRTSITLDNTYFSFKDLRIERFFDVEEIISNEIPDWEIPRIDPVTPAQIAASRPWSEFFRTGVSCDQTDLDDATMKVLIEIVKNPGGREGELIGNLGTTRYRFRRMKDGLLEDGYIKPFWTSRIEGMGYDVMMFTRMKLKPGLDMDDLFNRFQNRMPMNLTVMAYDHSDGIGIGLYRNLMEGSRAQSEMRNAMIERDLIIGEPEVKVFSLPNCIYSGPLSFHNPLESRDFSLELKDPVF